MVTTYDKSFFARTNHFSLFLGVDIRSLYETRSSLPTLDVEHQAWIVNGEKTQTTAPIIDANIDFQYKGKPYKWSKKQKVFLLLDRNENMTCRILELRVSNHILIFSLIDIFFRN